MAERPGAGSFAGFVAAASARGELVVQPRMGFAKPASMRAGLLAVRGAAATTVGTLTLDSYTRTGAFTSAAHAIRSGADLNGYPLVSLGPTATADMLDGVVGPDFPVQVRHGSPLPVEIVDTLVRAGLDATEGGPVSYCLPYSRTPLPAAVNAWARACERLVRAGQDGRTPHLESFGGCLLGQLCPPSLLIAISVLEGMFFRQHGVPSVSLSYAQQTNYAQDLEAIVALRGLAAELLSDVDHHVVVYTYMGLFPATEAGALALVRDSARLAVHGGAARLVVKTAAEAHRIPTTAENVAALEEAAEAARSSGTAPSTMDTGVFAEARTLIDACLELDPDIGRALVAAFRKGILDVPYCLHADNAGRTRSRIGADGRLEWADPGLLPVPRPRRGVDSSGVTARELLEMLSHVRHGFDALPGATAPRRVGPAERVVR